VTEHSFGRTNGEVKRHIELSPRLMVLQTVERFQSPRRH